jgi:lysophospholipase L1-like esterase
MALSISYVDAAGVAINWSTAVVNGVATTNIYSVTADDLHSNTFLWAPSGSPVSAAQVLAARADTVPAGGKARVGTLASASDIVNTGPGYSTRYLPTGATAGTIRGAQNNGEGTILVDALGSETIDGGTNSSLIQPGELVQFQSNGAGAWVRLSASNALLPNTYAPWAAARPGNRMVWFGDSLTQWQDLAAAVNAPTSTASHSQRVSLGNLGSILSNQQARYVTNAGVGGDTTAMMLARFDTDVTPHAPTVVHILGGTNDASGTLTTVTLPNLTAIIAKVRAIGAVPILGLIPPNNTTTKSEAFNAAYRRLAASLGVAVIDYCAPLVDPATGSYLATYNRDNTHPTDAGFVLMGQAFAAAFAKIAPPWVPPLPDRNASTSNLIANGLFLNPGATAFPSSWNGGSGTGITTTTETGAPIGNWVKVDAAASSGNAQLFQNIATAPVAGQGVTPRRNGGPVPTVPTRDHPAPRAAARAEAPAAPGA